MKIYMRSFPWFVLYENSFFIIIKNRKTLDNNGKRKKKKALPLKHIFVEIVLLVDLTIITTILTIAFCLRKIHMKKKR